MVPNIINTIKGDINKIGHPHLDPRLQRHTRSINGYKFSHHYLEPIPKLPQIKEKYVEDWQRMYPSYVSSCEELKNNPFSRRAVVFNTTHYRQSNGGVFECFLTFQILYRSDKQYDCVVYQRSSDLAKLEDDVQFFEYVMFKISRRVGIQVDKLIIHFGNIHYETSE